MLTLLRLPVTMQVNLPQLKSHPERSAWRASPQASRPGTPEDFGPTFENCRKLQELTTLIDLYSANIENTNTLLKGLMQSGLKDPNNLIIVEEKSYMELTNERLQQAVTTRGLLTTDHVILNHGQVTWTTPELAPPSPNYHTTPMGGSKTAGKYVKLYTDTLPQHHALNKLLEDLKYPFYTITPKHERPIKVVLKGLPRTTKTAEIHSDPLDLGFAINKVTQITGNITKQLLPVFIISLPRNPTNAKIFDLKKLSFLSITVEGFEITQCFQCNHTAEHCHLTPKCLKCGENHRTRDFQIKKLDTPF
ncbi:nucleic-acid-binding protein from transposon X-element [Trichonephila clavipes]|nr:nucleic-acid-binding protein from transposon X-element [Trichonephila clavipes]